MTPRMFVDFDGTITPQDVGNSFFFRFGGDLCTELVQEYRRGEISATECFRRETSALGILDLDAADEFVDVQPIDPSFVEFVEYCGDRKYALTIVSDGLEYYVRRILEREGLGGLEVFANTLAPRTSNSRRSTMVVGFPYADEVCDRCGCCKRNILLARSAESDCIVYVGDGYSDRCPVKYADIVFAKGDLQTHCQRENISYYLFSSFRDVIARLDQLSAKHLFRARACAERLRQRAFLQG